jgi:hypothetical protein
MHHALGIARGAGRVGQEGQWLSERLDAGERVVLASAGGAWHVADDARGTEALLGVLEGLEGARPVSDGPEAVSDSEAVAITEFGDARTYRVVARRFGDQGVLLRPVSANVRCALTRERPTRACDSPGTSTGTASTSSPWSTRRGCWTTRTRRTCATSRC